MPDPDLTRNPSSPGLTTATVPGIAPERALVVRELRELIAALDRRVPQVDRLGEGAIARAAAALRGEALQRIEELEAGG